VNRQWEAKRDFSGKREFPQPLDPWQQYAQVLLSANEFVFVD
jgi:superfamily II RNA helicase